MIINMWDMGEVTCVCFCVREEDEDDRQKKKWWREVEDFRRRKWEEENECPFTTQHPLVSGQLGFIVQW